MKVYVVENSGVADGDCYVGVEVYSTKAKAKKAFDSMVKLYRKDNRERGYGEETLDESFYEAWVMDDYSRDHDMIRILEKEIQ